MDNVRLEIPTDVPVKFVVFRNVAPYSGRYSVTFRAFRRKVASIFISPEDKNAQNKECFNISGIDAAYLGNLFLTFPWKVLLPIFVS
jgi:hypothetical protein